MIPRPPRRGFIKAVKGPPVVIKLIEGTQGIGVVLAETMEGSAKSVIESVSRREM